MIIAITGPTGSGKTTVSALLASRLDKCVNIDADSIKHLVVTGFIYDESSEGVNQWRLLGKNIGLLARNFADEGYKVIINGYINEPAWDAITDKVGLDHKFLLLPDAATNVARDSGRNEEIAMGEEAVTTHQEYFRTASYFKNFTNINTSEQTIEQTVDTLMSQIL